MAESDSSRDNHLKLKDLSDNYQKLSFKNKAKHFADMAKRTYRDYVVALRATNGIQTAKNSNILTLSQSLDNLAMACSLAKESDSIIVDTHQDPYLNPEAK